MLFFHSSPAVSHYIYFYTLKCNLNPNQRKKSFCARTKGPLGSASNSPDLSESSIHILCCLKRVIIITYFCVCVLEKAIFYESKVAGDVLHHCFWLTALQIRDLWMVFQIVATNDLLSPHYVHLSISTLTLCTPGRARWHFKCTGKQKL